MKMSQNKRKQKLRNVEKFRQMKGFKTNVNKQRKKLGKWKEKT